MPKIGFDVTMLVYSGSGVATYTYNLVKHLLLTDKTNEYHLFYSSLRRPKNFYYLAELKRLGGHLHSWRFPPRFLKFIWGQHHLIPIEWFTGKMDFFHTSDFLRPPLLPGTIGITTVHDLTWKKFPQWHTTDVIKYHTLKLAKTIKYQDIIIYPSICSQSDFTKYYPQAQNRGFVIPEGVGDSFNPNHPGNSTQILHKYGVKPPYLIYVGAIEPRKNLIRLIKAYSRLIRLPKYKQLSLVLGGRAGWKNEDIFNLVKRLKLSNRVVFTGFIQDQDLPVLYHQAACCCYVSLYEGFGLPPLEAQSCGCPVVASNTSSIPEVLQDSAVLVDPQKVTSIIQGIKKILSRRSQYQQLGLTNSARFNWNQTALGFTNIIKSFTILAK
jgi:glycosyltransferase involved in cell wall biosynthesis